MWDTYWTPGSKFVQYLGAKPVAKLGGETFHIFHAKNPIQQSEELLMFTLDTLSLRYMAGKVESQGTYYMGYSKHGYEPETFSNHDMDICVRELSTGYLEEWTTPFEVRNHLI